MKSREPDATWQDEDLVSQCLSGNELAWNALIEKYKRLVYSMPAKYRLPADEAADIFQHVWTDLYRDLRRLERPQSLRSWLITASARRCLLHKRRRQKRMLDAGLDPNLADGQPNAAQLHLEAEREQAIRDALMALPPRCRELVRLLFYEQPAKPYSEVAHMLGLAEGSIGFIRGRCLSKLRRILEEKKI